MATEAPVAPVAQSSPPPVAPSTAAPINVTPAVVDKGPQAPPPKPGSAKSRMFDDLRKKAGMEEEVKPAVTKTETVTESPETTTEVEQTTTTEAPETKTTPAPKGKVSPWKLVDEHKAARLKAETELAELRKAMVDPAKVKETEERSAKIEARAKELEEHIKYVDYSKSAEFKDKYQQPYEDAWKRWMGELGELTVQDPASGESRNIQPQDLLELVNMPLQKAREQAVASFGDFADDVMSARKEIRGLFDSQSKALEEARKGGTEREARQQQAMQAQREAMGKEIGGLWKQYNEAAAADENFGKLFKPVEGDEEGNTRLKKGYELADKAFSVNPLDPRLTPEQRKEVVQLHAAIRNRSAAFGRLAFQNQKALKEIESLKAELNKFKGSKPGAGEGTHERPDTVTATAKDKVFGALRQLAH